MARPDRLVLQLLGDSDGKPFLRIVVPIQRAGYTQHVNARSRPGLDGSQQKFFARPCQRVGVRDAPVLGPSVANGIAFRPKRPVTRTRSIYAFTIDLQPFSGGPQLPCGFRMELAVRTWPNAHH